MQKQPRWPSQPQHEVFLPATQTWCHLQVLHSPWLEQPNDQPDALASPKDITSLSRKRKKPRKFPMLKFQVLIQQLINDYTANAPATYKRSAPPSAFTNHQIATDSVAKN
jgi:hypothetical protein